ncbi:menaquinol-cytochrome c reductase cytochrome b/c subunit [Effusibacillus lacus]|uniref:Cytochrome c class I n=1 Tax=Effusibacillus lacus TaxID=1348429 RepID=A0A292YLV4_9BACL|nr:menaquinol-cytochrome c reductase cytochrome b/c subunit [Effusibacillus lacus]TCS75318.1 menaquinol-cytochrome c reductase cytochrome b/c subunit [Effusibacillus lacus]GAX89753.1 cytochrome c class I [Effusibacillus lacus]
MADQSGKERIPGVPRYRKPKDMPTNGTEPFFPNFLLKEWIVGSVLLVAFILWIVFNPVELAAVADPSDTSFIPVPDWYFLFLYQLLKYIPGDYVWLGTVVIPGIAMTLLALAPWLDRRKARHPFKRPIATGAMIVAVIFMAWLTREAEVQHEAALAKNPPKKKVELPKDTAIVDQADPAAKTFGTSCASCHGAELKGQLGPALLGIGNKYTPEQIEEIIKNGKPPGMPGGLVKGDDAKKLAEWLGKQKQK